MLAAIFNKPTQHGTFPVYKVKAQNQTQTITDLYLHSQLQEDHLKS